MKNEWTPGPWGVGQGWNRHHRAETLSVEREGTDAVVCEIEPTARWGTWPDEDPTATANAHLIAAAPDLYDALSDLVEAVMARDDHDTGEALADAERAMKRARGEDPGPRPIRREPEERNPYRL